MSDEKKVGLPDSLLDALSGGRLYWGDDKVNNFKLTGEGFELETAKGTITRNGTRSTETCSSRTQASLISCSTS